MNRIIGRKYLTRLLVGFVLILISIFVINRSNIPPQYPEWHHWNISTNSTFAQMEAQFNLDQYNNGIVYISPGKYDIKTPFIILGPRLVLSAKNVIFYMDYNFGDYIDILSTNEAMVGSFIMESTNGFYEDGGGICFEFSDLSNDFIEISTNDFIEISSNTAPPIEILTNALFEIK